MHLVTTRVEPAVDAQAVPLGGVHRPGIGRGLASLKCLECVGGAQSLLERRSVIKVHEVEVRPPGWYDSSVVTAKPAELPSEVIRSEQAARIAAMFKRWAVEDVSDEPDWDVDQVEQIEFSRSPAADEPSRS
jgi:hypothetical protein